MLSSSLSQESGMPSPTGERHAVDLSVTGERNVLHLSATGERQSVYFSATGGGVL